MLSTKPGKEAYIEPRVDVTGFEFTVKVGAPSNGEAARGTSAGRWNAFRCLMSGVPITYDYIRAEGAAGRLGVCLMALVAETDRRRVYLPPSAVATVAGDHGPWPASAWLPDLEINHNPRDIKTQIYGLVRYSDLFTKRQLTALSVFADLVSEAHGRVLTDLAESDQLTERAGYARAIALYLAFAQSKACNRNSSLCIWEQKMDRLVATFGRQALAMTWDYAETNPFAGAGGDFLGTITSVAEVIDRQFRHGGRGYAEQLGAVGQSLSHQKVVSTDPPYYDNIGYADLSDYFYVWLRRSLRQQFPELLSTVAVPKAEELVATPYRHGGKDRADSFFLEGMTLVMTQLASQAHPAFPLTIYYAFKQSETGVDNGTSSTGWETFLGAVINAGFGITGTWPVRTEQPKGLRAFEQNSLASSIVLVCRQRSSTKAASRREFVTALKAELPHALAHLQRGNTAPVDLAQAAIGPGMAVFTQYAEVLDAEGRRLSVRQALALINEVLDEALASQEGDFDADSRWALAWFDQYGFGDGPFGDADVLSKAKGTSVGGMVSSGILVSRVGKARLLRPDELPVDWDPEDDRRTNVWELLHHLIRVLEHGGEFAAAHLLARYGSKADVVRELAYRLYTSCERRKRAKEAASYNGLVQSWPEIVRLANEKPTASVEQGGLFDQE